ncbi:UDP-N-acetylglucosamine--N-acetylmuramyl-(pentapeptide) pyrophosphoryl-undecaprenol N-acetylglucosamine transferase [Flexibacter flexilis DSM 6793]|uniref:UDP-N-acetylglucosamine--N-acetylmuramyl-(pentapeptide) pyrophosphoryl-undecaprenol N-acetylglucosamine transferase n=1 Tax=Flexibacter flexilis DSM 6793 TaxID=927664 RepID=A0A1I1M9V2_9BACT|nr:undecaprenyldiphospho-muramoylpentapeptide beta-N-acetylglucosaminyltransferase [Flexibacter flexilis]SFC79978.1 UDP-N-acetylglucosamine--N-acetylmuramyl-(pentapeptide) pyrophosphoryl-undecaprenol N-acetylglucosamine transferase [Flexibacter flexilis DSM 6793]
MRVIISGGGTGGHIYPAIAIANALKAKNPATEILFVGAQGRMEMQKVPAAGYEIIGLDIAGFQRELTLKNLSFPIKVVKSLWAARQIVKDFRPDVAVGVGGYASGPLLWAASGLGVPTLIQEQNSYAGVTNKLLSSKAAKICVAYEGMDKFFPKNKIMFTGNPVRSDIVSVTDKNPEALSFFGLNASAPVLLVIGGSLGARTLNESMEQGLAKLQAAGCQVIWQTGKHFSERAKAAAQAYESVKVFDFINRMDLAYSAADVVVSRAGALSVSELCLVRKPAILVPSPNVAEDHQTKNAMALVSRKAALMVTDAAARQELVGKVLDLLQNTALQQELKQNIATLGRPDAASQIADEVINISK